LGVVGWASLLKQGDSRFLTIFRGCFRRWLRWGVCLPCRKGKDSLFVEDEDKRKLPCFGLNEHNTAVVCLAKPIFRKSAVSGYRGVPLFHSNETINPEVVRIGLSAEIYPKQVFSVGFCVFPD
jgi:hypothetical protein